MQESTAKRTRLLVSVRDLDEARDCLEQPIDILDFKEPRCGALGAVPVEVLQRFLVESTARTIPGASSSQPQLSFATGELGEQIAAGNRLTDLVPHDILQTFHYAKIGLEGCCRIEGWQSHWQNFFAGDFLTEPVMVAYLDHATCDAPNVEDCLRLAQVHPRCQTLLLDTFSKSSDLFSSIDDAELTRVIRNAKALGLRSVVAGSVSMENLDRVRLARPDLVGVRGAVCSGDRGSRIDRKKVAEFARQVLDRVPAW